MTKVYPPESSPIPPHPVPWFGDEVWAIQDISFNSNGTTYDAIAMTYGDHDHGVYKEWKMYFGFYPNIVVATILSATAWTDEAYRTITLDSPATGDFLTWLEANAVKQ